MTKEERDKIVLEQFDRIIKEWKSIVLTLSLIVVGLVFWLMTLFQGRREMIQELEAERVKFHRITAKELGVEEAKFNKLQAMAKSIPQLNSQEEAFLQQRITTSKIRYSSLDKKEKINYERLAKIEYIKGLAQLRAIKEAK